MPIYEFKCQECDDEFEKLVRNAATGDPIRCPACGSIKVTKQVSVFASQARGTSSTPFSPAASCSTGAT